MKTKGYLIVGKNGSLRAVKSIRADIGAEEIVVAINLEIPDSAFKPMIHAEIKIAEKDVQPFSINAGKLAKTAEIISGEIGLNVTLKTVEVESKKK